MWWWRAQGWWSLESQILAAVTTIIVFGLALAALVLLLQYLRTRNLGPEDILARRYAKGNIDEDVYRHGLAVLRQGADHPPSGTA